MLVIFVVFKVKGMLIIIPAAFGIGMATRIRSLSLDVFYIMCIPNARVIKPQIRATNGPLPRRLHINLVCDGRHTVLVFRLVAAAAVGHIILILAFHATRAHFFNRFFSIY